MFKLIRTISQHGDSNYFYHTSSSIILNISCAQSFYLWVFLCWCNILIYLSIAYNLLTKAVRVIKIFFSIISYQIISNLNQIKSNNRHCQMPTGPKSTILLFFCLKIVWLYHKNDNVNWVFSQLFVWNVPIQS